VDSPTFFILSNDSFGYSTIKFFSFLLFLPSFIRIISPFLLHLVKFSEQSLHLTSFKIRGTFITLPYSSRIIFHCASLELAQGVSECSGNSISIFLQVIFDPKTFGDNGDKFSIPLK